MSAFVEFGSLIPDVVTSAGMNADHRHRETRAKLYRQMPNDNMKLFPLTKIVLSNAGASVTNPKYEWGMFAHNDRYVEPTGAYSDVLSTAIAADAQTASGSTVYLKMAAASARQFTKYEEIELRFIATTASHAANYASVHCHVDAVTINGATSYLTLTTLETDNGWGGGGATENVLGQGFAGAAGTVYASMLSTAMPEGSKLPWQRYREPTEQYNYTQIIMAGLSLTGTELSNTTRFDENTYNMYLKQMHDQFNSYIERAILFGTRKKTTQTLDMGNGNQSVDQYATGGLRYALKNMGNMTANTNILNIPTITTYGDYNFSGKTFLEGGYDFLKVMLLEKSRKSGMRKQLYCGCDAMLALQNLFESQTNVQVDPKFKNKWGFEVTKVYGLNCELELIQHADLSCNPGWTTSAFLIEPEKIGVRTKKGRDMTLIRSAKDLKAAAKVENGFDWRDGVKEGIVADMGFIFDDIDGMAIINGIGQKFHS